MDAGSDLWPCVKLSDSLIKRQPGPLILRGRRSPVRLHAAAVLALTFLFTLPLAPAALIAGDAPDLLPDTSIAPANTVAPPASPAPPRRTAPPRRIAFPRDEGANATASSAPIVHHQAPRANATPIPNFVFDVEPADARVILRSDAAVYMQPSKMSPIVEQLQTGQPMHVTGSTHYFLQIKLKNGSVGYVLSDDAYLTVPADKIFRLTSTTPVLERPNKWAKQLATVHQGHDVHVVGVALDYMKIQMKSGLEGYIATRALE